METPNLNELLSPENFPLGDPLRGDAERELDALRSTNARLEAKAALADEIAAAYRETSALWQWQTDWLRRHAALSDPKPAAQAEGGGGG